MSLSEQNKTSNTITLPTPQRDGPHSLENAIAERRSVREFRNEPIDLKDIAQLLWAGQGVTEVGGKRTAPSAGALYPLEVHCVARNVTDLPAGVYRYIPEKHELKNVERGDKITALAGASYGQTWIADSAAAIVISAVYARTERKYGERAARYVHLEAGHAAQNICLQAHALKLGTAPVGAFNDNSVREVVKMPRDEQPLYVLPLGKPR